MFYLFEYVYHVQNMIFKQVEPSKSIGFLVGMRTIFLRKTLACRIFVNSAHSISWWSDVRARRPWLARTDVWKFRISTFRNPKMLFSKGWSLKTVHFLGILGTQLIQNFAEWFGRFRLSRKIWEIQFCDVLKLNVTNPGCLLQIPKNPISTFRAYELAEHSGRR